MNQLLFPLIAAITGVTSGYATYQIAKHKNSGEIGTSDAAQLWTESNAMRKELRDELLANRKEIAESRIEIKTLRGEVSVLRSEVKRLKGKLKEAGINHE